MRVSEVRLLVLANNLLEDINPILPLVGHRLHRVVLCLHILLLALD